jgi:hypothetical protein
MSLRRITEAISFVVGHADVGQRLPAPRQRLPGLAGVLDRILADCSAEARYATTAKNVVELYELPFEA